MNASYTWLRDFVEFDLSPGELRDLLTARCATVEDVVPLRQDLAGIVIGRVLDAARHPNSDHLWVTRVDSGTGTVHRVVCGAPNVTVGTLYPFARVGATLPGGVTIEKRKIRGELSEGMLCSARELGLGTDHEGILALDVEAEPGTPFLEVMRAGDSRLVVDVLPNRPDLLSHEGIAREIAGATGSRLTRPTHPPAVLTRAVSTRARPPIAVNVEDTDGAPRYLAIPIHGVTIGPSPQWLASRIEAAGARSISNVVDVTNYMLHGFGQPMHAFDMAKLAGDAVIVRRARNGEKLVTLDGVERTLDDSMTVIADDEKAAAIAGVIGGKGSEVTDSTTEILLEVAAFDPKRIRATRRRLGISTDASYRFERGVDQSAIADLAAYAAELITRVAGGTAQPSIDIGAPVGIPAELRLRPERVNRVLGHDISAPDIERHLSSVGFVVRREGDDIMVTPPSFRSDVTGEVDLIEEVARLHGYDSFPADVRAFRPGTVPDAPLEIVSRRVRAELVSSGLFEARPMPFVSTGSEPHRVRNPLAENEAFFRTSVLDSLGGRVEYNWSHMQKNVRLFEIGTVFTEEADPNTGAPVERTHVAAAVTGDRRPAHFTEPHPPQFDEWDAKAMAESVSAVAYPGADIQLAPSVGDVLWTIAESGRAIGSVSRLTLDSPLWAAPVFGVEIDLGGTGSTDRTDTATDAGKTAHTHPASTATVKEYVAIPRTPAIEVDLALLVPEEVTSARAAEEIRASAGDLLESLAVFDEFRGPGVAAGSRSLGWRLTFRHPERTLREREIQGRTAKILKDLEAALGIRQRTS
ncbi:MAG TPA: phenylalanine--tRNA ligase subunit beta [Gemmatimonadaceae bacterium]|nr:phenylalanine--tRNA ligase subunit beta [Gemmatimonadaceae bacterium]